MRIGIFSKEPLFMDALAGMLSSKANHSIVATEDNLRELIAHAKHNMAHALVLDGPAITDSDVQFLEGARALSEMKFIVVNSSETTPKVSNADAIMTKKDSGKQLLEVLDGLEQSIPVMEVREGKRGYRRGNNLSHREFQVAEYVSKGYSNRTISEVSGLQEQSVKNLVSVVMRKLNCENRTQVALRLLANDVGPIVD